MYGRQSELVSWSFSSTIIYHSRRRIWYTVHYIYVSADRAHTHGGSSAQKSKAIKQNRLNNCHLPKKASSLRCNKKDETTTRKKRWSLREQPEIKFKPFTPMIFLLLWVSSTVQQSIQWPSENSMPISGLWKKKKSLWLCTYSLPLLTTPENHNIL